MLPGGGGKVWLPEIRDPQKHPLEKTMDSFYRSWAALQYVNDADAKKIIDTMTSDQYPEVRSAFWRLRAASQEYAKDMEGKWMVALIDKPGFEAAKYMELDSPPGTVKIGLSPDSKLLIWQAVASGTETVPVWPIDDGADGNPRKADNVRATFAKVGNKFVVTSFNLGWGDKVPQN
jgi:hypothetical protein